MLVGAVLFVAANTWMALHSVQRLEDSRQWVDHTWEIIAQTERMMSDAKDAETGSRGYLLTGEQRFLGPFRSAQKSLPRELDAFQHLTADNPVQQQNIVEMRAILEQRLGLLDQSNLLRASSSNVDTVQAMVLMDTGKVQMDRLRHVADGMETEERRLLAIRLNDANAAGKRVRGTIALASALDLILIIFMFRYFVRERDLRLSAEATAKTLATSRLEIERNAAEIQALNESLELRVQQRTAELEATNRELEAFSYSVSHDLRAPLRTIDGFSLALEEDFGEVVGAEGKDYIQRVRTGVQRMGGLIDALLQLSRITRADIEREPVNLTELAVAVGRPDRAAKPRPDDPFHRPTRPRSRRRPQTPPRRARKSLQQRGQVQLQKNRIHRRLRFRPHPIRLLRPRQRRRLRHALQRQALRRLQPSPRR